MASLARVDIHIDFVFIYASLTFISFLSSFLLKCRYTVPICSDDKPPSESPTIDNGDAMEACFCEANDYEWEQSWKCGDDEIYLCPGVADDKICSTQAEGSKLPMKYYSITEDQCNTMRSLEIGQRCINLPEYYGIDRNDDEAKTISSRVCYTNGGLGLFGMKQDDESCESCPSTIDVNFEVPIQDPNNDIIDEDVVVNTGGAMEACLCQADDYESEQSWKCGNDIYVCPGISDNKICSTQGSTNSKYFSITEDQCNEMRLREIGDKCLSLPEYGVTNPRGLSNRVCYKDFGLGINGMKQDDQSCDVCKSTINIDFEVPLP